MDDFNATVLSRLPLAEAVLKILSHVAGASLLEQVYERYKGRTYSKVLTFTTIIRLLTDAIVCAAPMESVIPTSLRSTTLIAIDGKKLKNVAKRIKPLRG